MRVLLLLSLAGCGLRPGPGDVRFRDAELRSAATPEIETREFALAGGFIQLTVQLPSGSAFAGPRPVVIGAFADEAALLSRGIAVARFENRWRMISGLRCLAREGDEPSSPDCDPEAGPEPNRVGSWMLAAPRPGVVGRGYFALIRASASGSVPAVVDRLVSLPEIDAGRIAIAGSSTNGFTALEALVFEPRLAAGAVRVACGDYETFLRGSSLALAGDERWLEDGELVLDPEYEAELREAEPIRFADRFPPRPLLLQTGADDPVIPAPCARRTADVLAEAYARAGVPERFRYSLYEDRGHDLGVEALDEVLGWWERWLLDEGGGRASSTSSRSDSSRRRTSAGTWTPDDPE